MGAATLTDRPTPTYRAPHKLAWDLFYWCQCRADNSLSAQHQFDKYYLTGLLLADNRPRAVRLREMARKELARKELLSGGKAQG